MRPSGRQPEQLRDVNFSRHCTKHAESLVLVAFGDIRVICPASVEDRVPGFLRGKGQAFSPDELLAMLALAGKGIATLTQQQRESLNA